MIGRIRGVLVARREATVTIDVAGVGYEVEMTPRDLATMPGLGEEVVVHTHTHVREDDLSLYGFAADGDREMFRALISASGVGPRLAMGLLGSMTSAEITRAIVTDDPDALTVAPGVGKRGAQKMVLELAPKLVGREIDLRERAGDLGTGRDALEGLGYTTAEINHVLLDVDPDEPLESQIKSALQRLGRG
jgi:Holliday junction DNA helicase RuvA